MKHTFTLLMALFMALSLSAKRTVFSLNEKDCSVVYAYAGFNMKGSPEWIMTNSDWPGMPCDSTNIYVRGHRVWSYTWEDEERYNHIIFNNGTSNQTYDLVPQLGQCYSMRAGKCFAKPQDVPEKVPMITVYFVNKIGWEHVYAYAATGDNWRPENAEWPGEELKVDPKIKVKYGPVYKFSFPAAYGHNHLIFNCGNMDDCSDQTLDCGVHKDMYVFCAADKTGAVKAKWVTLQQLKK